MNNKAWYAIATIVIVGAAAYFVSGESLSGRFSPGSERDRGDRGAESSAPVPRSYSSEMSTPSGELQSTKDSAFSPEALPVNNNINRAQLAMLIAKTLDEGAGYGLGIYGYKDCANDLPASPGIYGTSNIHNVICYIKAMGIMSGYGDGSFKPYGTVTRAEAAQVFGKAFGPGSGASMPPPVIYADVKANDWFYGSVRWLVNSKVTDIVSSPKNNFFPGGLLTNGRAIYWMNNVKKNVPKSLWVK